MNEKKVEKFLKAGIAMLIIPVIVIIIIDITYLLVHRDSVTFWILIISLLIIVLANFVGIMSRRSILKRKDLEDNFKEKFTVKKLSQNPQINKLWQIAYVFISLNAFLCWPVIKGETWIFFLWLFFLLLAGILLISAYLVEKRNKRI